MLRGTTVLLGPARSGKTRRLIEAYRGALERGPLGAALWLSPTHRSAAATSGQLLGRGLPGCFSPNCLTFDQLARRILEASAVKTRAISLALERQILRRLIDAARQHDQLRYFAPIADRPGFLDLVVGFIRELKRLEIWPHELSEAYGPRESEKDRELCFLYDAYQRELTEHDLFDAQGRFWSARNELRQRWPRALGALRHVFVDGFNDFTRTEHEMLDILAERVESLTISLPGEASAERDDLFAKSAKTLAELRRRHEPLSVEELPRLPSDWPAMRHLEEHLFANPLSDVVAVDTTGLEIMGAAGATHEIELLARRIKSLLVEGDRDAGGARVRPEEILVIFRSLDESADQLREVFGQFGIPVAIPWRPTLRESPVLAALANWLRLDLDDWPYRQVLAILTHNYFRPAWPQWRNGRAAAAAERLVHQLQIASGRDKLLAGADRLARHAAARRESDETDRGSARLADETTWAAGLFDALLARAFDKLPAQGTLTEWSAALARFAEAVGLLVAGKSGVAGRGQATDRAAWQQMLTALAASARLATWTGSPPEVYSKRSFFDHLEEILHCEPLPVEYDETGCVRVLSAEDARNLSAPYVFIAGLAEKAFPPPHGDDCLHSQSETAELVAAGLPLVPHEDRSRYEMLLFYEIVTRATRRLILSYPALDPKAQPLSPSPFLIELEHACRPLRIARTAGPELSMVPPSDDVLSPRELRVRAVAQLVAGEPGLLGELHGQPGTEPAADNILAGLQVTCARRQGQTYGPFEGMLLSSAATAALTERYGSERCWSPSQLEQYARCPHQFFLQRVLALEPLEELGLEIDYLGRGQMLHQLLSTLHGELTRRLGRPGSPADQSEPEFLARVQTLLGELLASKRRGHGAQDGLLEVDGRRVGQVLANYWQQHAAYDAQWSSWDAPPRPAHFEVAFGPSRHGSEPEGEGEASDTLSTNKPFELACGDETIRFSGRIDRIDVGAVGDQVVFNIVDYKSGRKSTRTNADSVKQGYSLQLPLYALAAEQLLSGSEARPYRAAYWHLAGDGYKEVLQFRDATGDGLTISADWAALELQLRQRVRSLVDGIRGGQFPMHSVDKDCTARCAYRTACRVNQTRSLEKIWQPPGATTP